MRLLIALIVWIGAVAGAGELSTVVAHSIHNAPAGAAGTSGSGSGGGGSDAGSSGAPLDASSVKPTDALSLFRTSNFTRALTTVRSHLGAGAQLDMLALYPGYLDLTAVRAGSEVNVYIAADGRYTETNTGGNPGGSALFSLKRVKTDVPAALARRIATSGHVPESQLNYMVVQVDPADHHFRWLVYPRQGNRVEYFQATGATGSLLEYLTNSSTGLRPVRG
jgi:hypothetical protein